MKVCEKCGSVLPDEAAFCASCGNAFQQNQENSQQANNQGGFQQTNYQRSPQQANAQGNFQQANYQGNFQQTAGFNPQQSNWQGSTQQGNWQGNPQPMKAEPTAKKKSTLPGVVGGIVVFIICFTIGFFIARSNTEEQNMAEENTAYDEVPVQANDPAAESKPTLKEYYLSNASLQAELETIKKSCEGQGLEFDMLIDGNSLVYVYKYTGLGKSDELAAALESKMAELDSEFQSTAEMLKTSVSNETVTLVVRCLDMNGEEIYSKSYTAQ